jgi:Calcineurin-like phosphoesterase
MSKLRNYLFVGDSHGDMEFATRASLLARQHGAEIVQCGDWGFLWPGHSQLKELSDMLVGDGVLMRFVDGNHEDHVSLRKLLKSSSSVANIISPNVLYQPRGSTHEDEDGTRFLFLGGAPSIDRASRIAGESWWPEEIITDTEWKRAMAAKGPFHVLVTHDAPAFPPGFSPKGSPGYRHDQDRSMKLIDSLITQHRPQLHVHGHWHARYKRRHPSGALVIGLDCNQPDSTHLNDSTLLWSRMSRM